MLRIVAFICIVILFSSCEKAWRRLHIEKRVYRDGWYIHLPWERRAPINSYPKPRPYPVDHSRTSQTDSTKKNSGGVPSTGGNPSPQTQTAGSGTGNGSSGSGTGGGSGATGGNGVGSGNQPNPTTGSTGYGAQQPNGTNATYQLPPPLQPIPQATEPPLQRPQGSPAPPIAVVNDTTPTKPAEPSEDRGFDFPEGEFSMIAELGFYNPILTEGIAIKPTSYNAGGAMRFTIHPWSRHKFSLEAGLFISQHFIAQNQRKASPLFIEEHDHERLMQFKTRFMLMDHVYVLRSPVAKMDAVELGVFSDLSFFSTHVAIDNTGNTKEASLTRNKSRLFGLHYLHNAQFGMTARIANEVLSVFANYRFTQLVKAAPDGGDLPKLVVGATFAFGE